MKAILTKKQVEMLLEGKKLTYGRRSLMIPKEGEIPDQLRIWLSDDRYQKRISVVVDTNELSIDFVLREGTKQECL
jgi:hypothetical protein